MALDWLAHRARQSAEGQSAVDPVPSHLAARERVGGFAAAVFEDLPVDRLEEVEDELFRFARTVETTPPLRSALADRDLPVTVRRGVVDQLLAGKVQPATLRLVEYAIEGGRPRDIVGTLFWLVDQTAEARGWRVAQVDSAREVDDDERAPAVELLGPPGRSAGRAAGDRRPLAAGRRAGPDRRSSGGGHGPRSAGGAPRAHGRRAAGRTQGSAPSNESSTRRGSRLMAELTIDANDITEALRRHVDEYTPAVGHRADRARRRGR